jgi:hypothetical protein
VAGKDTTVHEDGVVAEELGREDAVDRETKSATVAASFRTRDHDVIRTWAEQRGGAPAMVEGTGEGVLRIAFHTGAGVTTAAGSRTSTGTPSSPPATTATSTSSTRSAPATGRRRGSTSSCGTDPGRHRATPVPVRGRALPPSGALR